MLGKKILDLVPTPENPRNSEGAMLRMADGSILFAYSRYSGGTCGDHAPADIYTMSSRDEGESWSEPMLAIDHRIFGNIQNVMSVSMIRLENGDAGLFYLVKRGPEDTRPELRRSSDSGKTWGDPVCCVPKKGYYVVNNDRLVRLSDGSLYFPAALHRTLINDRGEMEIEYRAEMTSFCSHDDGRTWEENPGRCILNPGRFGASGLQEPGVLELSPGCLWGWARTDLGCQYETFSVDNGRHWTPPTPSMFTSPCSPMSVRRTPAGEILAVWNPVPNYNGRVNPLPRWNDGRTPFVCALSRDNGQSFSAPQVIEQEPESGYCYCSMFFTRDDSVLLAYCAGGQEDPSCLCRLRIRKIPLAQIRGNGGAE